MNTTTKRIYLDYNATTPLSPEVFRFYVQELELYANASSLHDEGRRAAKAIEKARGQVGALINAGAETILFTSGGSESNNTVFNSMSEAAEKRGRNLIVTTAIEHPCVMESAKRLEAKGFQVIYLPADRWGIVDDAAYRDALAKKPLLVSVMAANNEIGTVQDIPLLAALAREAGALFHTDAVQAAGKIPVDAAAWGVDYLTLSGHKIYGPKGVGALYIRKGSPFTPFIRGGHQEQGKRAGTYNSPAIAAFGLAAEEAASGLSEYEARTRPLRNRLREGLLAAVPEITINGHPEKSLPNTLDISFPGAEGEAILLYLDLLGVSVSTGSACASGNLEPSHVLIATGIGPELAHGSIRFSLGKYTTQEEIDYVLKELPPVIDRLRKMSTLSSERKG